MVKRGLKHLLASRWIAPLWSPLTRGRVPIFMLHRFALPDLGVEGHDAAELGRRLERLRRERYRLIGLEAAVEALRSGRALPRRPVVFTVDDGYADFARVAADVFLAHDCPVTVFLSTGFLDGALWHWWDQIEYVFRHAGPGRVELRLGGEPVRVELGGAAERRREAAAWCERCKRVPERVKQAFIGDLASAAGVEIPALPPAEYAPMSWDDARRLEAAGVTFAPHCVSHPVLTRTDDEESERQIREAWASIRGRLRRPLPVLAYPSGAFGEREVAAVARLGLSAAVATVPRYAAACTEPDAPFRLPRFGYNDAAEFFAVASGLMRAVQLVRGRRA